MGSMASLSIHSTIIPKPNNTFNSFSLPNSFLASTKSLTHLRLRPQSQSQSRPPTLIVASAQSELLKAVQTAWKIGKDGIEAGTDLVPVSIPRPIARIGVGGAVLSVAFFVLKSFLSTAFFVLGMMGLIYFLFLALNKDEGPRGGGGGGGGSTTSDDSTLEEARRIMEKYK